MQSVMTPALTNVVAMPFTTELDEKKETNQVTNITYLQEVSVSQAVLRKQ